MSEIPQDLIKTKDQIQTMREGGKILAKILNQVKKLVISDVLTLDLEKKFLELCSKYNVEPSCKGYAPSGLPPFPTGLCLSLNNQSVHCYPKEDSFINEGDLVNIDTVVKYKDMHLDSAFAVGVGKLSSNKEKLLNTSKIALEEAIKKVKDGVNIGVISNTIMKTAEKNGFGVLTQYAGHGIGKEMHQYPEIPCIGKKSDGPELKEGMTICIESLLCEGELGLVKPTGDWETEMYDGKNFCQFEHTILVTKTGHEILTIN